VIKNTSIEKIKRRSWIIFNEHPKTPYQLPPKTKIQKQGLTPYQLVYSKEMLLYAIVRKVTSLIT